MRWQLALACSVVVTVGCSGKKSKDDPDPIAPPAAFGVAALSFDEPDANIEFTWTPVDGATGYTIYFQTTPGVTAASATAIPVADPLSSSLGTTVTACFPALYARIASVGPDGEGPLSTEDGGSFCPGSCDRPVAHPAPGFVVSPAVGSDATTVPSCFPFATLAAAIAGRASGDVVFAMDGAYVASDLLVPAGVTLVGNPVAPANVTIDGSAAAVYSVGLEAGAALKGVSVTAPARTGVRAIGANTLLQNVRTTGNATGVQLDATGATIDGLVSTGNTGAGLFAGFAVERWSAGIANSVLKNNAVGLYIDSFYVSSTFSITSSAIACSSQRDIHAYVPDTASPATTATITFLLSGLKMDEAVFRREEAATCPTAGVELCVPQTQDVGETPGVVVFDETDLDPAVEACP